MSKELPVSANPTWDGKYPLVGLKIVEDFPRPDKELLGAFNDCFLPDISDWVGILYTMDYRIRPAYQPMRRLVGPAFTVKVPPGDNLMVKKAIHMAHPGDVIVVDARGHTDWCCGGGGMISVAKARGVEGFVIDGAYRDIEQIQNMGVPFFLKGVSPATGPKRGPGEINVPVCCGGVIVHPGDIIVGNHEGIVCIPQAHAKEIADKVRPIKVKLAASDWDWDAVVSSDKPRDEYFDEVLEFRGCEYVKGSGK